MIHRRRRGWGKQRFLVAVAALLVLMSACRPALLDPPRTATLTAVVENTRTPAAPVELPAPTPTGQPVGTSGSIESPPTNPELVFWGLQQSNAESEALQAIVDGFNAENDINVELFLVEPQLLSNLMHTAVISDSFELPDLVMLPLEFTAGWVEQGILNSQAATTAVNALDPATFDQDALRLVETEAGYAAVPSDGWQQLLVYRQDWFAERGLAPPISYTAMISAGAVISNSTALIAGYNMPTESSLLATTRAFEQMALANGCQLIDAKGELLILSPACQEALEFYRRLCNSLCPPGVQTEISANNSYLSGRAGMVLASPALLAQMAGLDPLSTDPCPECVGQPDYLANNSGILTELQGSVPGAAAANLGNVIYLGVTTAADPGAAAAFLEYWYEDGYLTWLSAHPELKVPMRRGTPDEPDRFVAAWHDLPLRSGSASLAEIYGDEVADLLASNVVNPERWGFGNGQGSLVSEVYESLMFSALLQELLSGYYSSDRAAIEGYKRLVELIPDYAYYVDPEPTPEAEDDA
jgi:multiple sugar transport system substrate-binding protein